MITDVLEFLKSIPLAAWTAFIAFFGVWLTSWNSRKSLTMQLEHSERLQSQQHHRERLEELYILISEWAQAMRSSNAHMSMLMKGVIHPQEYLDSINNPENAVDFNRLEMLVGIYGDRVITAFKEVMAVRNDMSKTLKLCFDSLENGSPDASLILQIESKEPLFNQCMKNLQGEIVKAAKEV